MNFEPRLRELRMRLETIQDMAGRQATDIRVIIDDALDHDDPSVEHIEALKAIRAIITDDE